MAAMMPIPREDATSSPEEEALLESAVADDPAAEIEELDDGSAVIYEDEVETRESAEFGANLADDGTLSERDLHDLGTELCELIEKDQESRSERDKQYAEGIKRTGLGGEAPGGAEFDGASRAVHPMLAKGCVDFASRAIKELMPAQGPCRTQIIGESTDEKLDKAERKKTFLNWQLTTQVMENRAEYERLLSQLPLGGSQYKRWWWDDQLRRPRTEVVYVDDVFLPYEQSDFYSSHRVTHLQKIDKITYESRIASGLYRDLDLAEPSSMTMEQSAASKATEKIEGSTDDGAYHNDDGLRHIYQVFLDKNFEEDKAADRTAPYVVHIDRYTERVLGIFRNWREGDETYAKKHWMVEYTFIPWRGAYGIGLSHLIGSLSAASTGALRALLDSAHISNFPGGLKLKAGRTAGQSITVNATELQDIDAPPGVDDIRKLVMGFPFNGPSEVLFKLLDWLGQQAEIVVATASEKIADGGADMPMGTALALIEHGAVNFSAIHARMHASLKRELEIIHRLNAENLSDEETIEDLGELVVSRKDFAGPMDVIPVSDPNIFSEAQRYAQLQAVMSLMANPVLMRFFKPERVLQRALKLLQLPAPEDIATLPKDPKKLDPLDENYVVSITDPSPIKVYFDQDDLAHLEAHLMYMTSPMFGGSPLVGPQALPVLLSHCKEHLLNLWKKHASAAAQVMMTTAAAQGIELNQTQAQSKAHAFVDQMLAGVLGQTVMPALAKASELAAQYAPKPPVDPVAMLNSETQKGIEASKQQGETQRVVLRLKAEGEQKDKDRMADDQRAALEAEIEARDQATNERLAQFAASVEVIRDESKSRSEEAQLAQKAEYDKQLTILQSLLQQGMEGMQGAVKGDEVNALIEQATQSSAQQIMAQLQAMADDTAKSRQALETTMQQAMQQIGELRTYNDAERVAEYVMGPDGTKRGVRSYIKRPDGTPDRVREFPLPSNPAAQQQQPQPQLPAPPAPGAMP